MWSRLSQRSMCFASCGSVMMRSTIRNGEMQRTKVIESFSSFADNQWVDLAFQTVSYHIGKANSAFVDFFFEYSLVTHYSSVLNCKGGHFAIFRFFQPQSHLKMTPHFMNFVPKVSKTFIFLGKITEITPISLYYDPLILWFFTGVSTPCLFDPPLQLSTEEY